MWITQEPNQTTSSLFPKCGKSESLLKMSTAICADDVIPWFKSFNSFQLLLENWMKHLELSTGPYKMIRLPSSQPLFLDSKVSSYL